jgi:RimJ/RimL family protein N-acetyltransferase
MDVFLLWHVRHAKNLDGSPIEHRGESGELEFDQEYDDLKLVGVYADELGATEAVERARSREGFRDEPDCFDTESYTLGEDHWAQGFVTIPEDRSDGHALGERVRAVPPVVRESPWPMRLDSLLFREVADADIEALQSFRNDPGVNWFMVRTSVDPDELRRDWLAASASATDYSCVVERDGQVVAMGFLDIVDGPGQPGHPRGTDGVIGYIVDPAVAGQGIGSATARALLRAAFDGLGLRRVTARANADNVASVRVLERAGMRRERHALKALWHHELGWLDEVEYAILADEWEARS